MVNFRRITLFCLEKRLPKHKTTILSKNLGGHDPFDPPWLRLRFDPTSEIFCVRHCLWIFKPCVQSFQYQKRNIRFEQSKRFV